MRNLRGTRQARILQGAMRDLIDEFDEELTKSGLPGRMIDSHVAAILIDLLQVIVVERHTFSGEDLTEVFEQTLQERQHEH